MTAIPPAGVGHMLHHVRPEQAWQKVRNVCREQQENPFIPRIKRFRAARNYFAKTLLEEHQKRDLARDRNSPTDDVC